MGALGQGVLSGVAEGFSDELKQRRKRKEEGADALRNKQADQLEQAMKNTQARGALQPGAPGYLKPEEVKQHIEDAQKQLTALYEPEEAPLLFQRLKGIFTKQQPQQTGLELKPGMTLADVLAGSGPAPAPQDTGRIITPKPFQGADKKWYVVREDAQGNLKQQEIPGYSEESEIQEYMDAGLSEGDAQKAVRIRLGLEPKAAEPKPNEKEKDISDYLEAHNLEDTAANRDKARKAIARRGKDEPGSFMPLYDGKGNVVGAWDAKSGRMVKSPKDLPGTTSAGAGISAKKEAATQKQTAPLESVIEEANLAPQLKQQGDAGNPEADAALALTFFKVMRGATGGAGGSGGGIRFTQQEQNLIFGSRSLWDTMEVKGNKVLSNGQPLAAAQRQQIVDTIQLYQAAAQRKLDEIKGGASDTTVDDVAKGLTAE